MRSNLHIKLHFFKISFIENRLSILYGINWFSFYKLMTGLLLSSFFKNVLPKNCVHFLDLTHTFSIATFFKIIFIPHETTSFFPFDSKSITVGVSIDLAGKKRKFNNPLPLLLYSDLQSEPPKPCKVFHASCCLYS